MGRPELGLCGANEQLVLLGTNLVLSILDLILRSGKVERFILGLGCWSWGPQPRVAHLLHVTLTAMLLDWRALPFDTHFSCDISLPFSKMYYIRLVWRLVVTHPAS